jgi:hypothetical protein
MTASAMSEERDRRLVAGMDDFIFQTSKFSQRK